MLSKDSQRSKGGDPCGERGNQGRVRIPLRRFCEAATAVSRPVHSVVAGEVLIKCYRPQHKGKGGKHKGKGSC